MSASSAPSSRGARVPSRILLVRHGRSAHEHRGGWLDARGVEQWRSDYDAAGIRDDDAPPAELITEGERAGMVVASDLQRAIASAERLVPGRPIPVSPLLRETPLAIPTWMPIRLPIGAWDAVMTVGWGVRILRGTDASIEARRQAIAAANWLTKLAREHASVMVLTHGVFRRLLAARLGVLGWQFGSGRRTFDHWSVWPLHAEIDPIDATPAGTPVVRRR